MSASWPSRCSWCRDPGAGNASSSTRSPRGCTIPAIGPSRAPLTSQFEQHVRAVCGWPLGATAGSAASRCTTSSARTPDPGAALLAEPGAHLHLYGKARSPARPQDGPRDPRFPGKRLIRPAFKHPAAGHLFCGADPWTSRACSDNHAAHGRGATYAPPISFGTIETAPTHEEDACRFLSGITMSTRRSAR